MTLFGHHNTKLNSKVPVEPETLGQIIAAIAALIGLFAILPGHVLGAPAFNTWFPNLPGMSLESAFSAMTLSVGLIMAQRDRRNAGIWAVAAAILVLMLVGRNLLNAPAILDGSNRGIPVMSFKSSTAFGLLAIGLMAHATLPERLNWVTTVIATVGTFLGWLSLTGFMFNAPEMNALPFMSGTSVPTSVAILSLSLSLLLIEARTNWTRVFFQPAPGSRDGLLLLPVAALAPVIAYRLLEWANESDLLPNALTLPVATISFSLLLFAVIYLVTRVRTRNSQLRADMLAYLSNVLDGIDVATLVYDLNGKPLGTNAKALEICAGSQSPFDWLETTNFYETGAQHTAAYKYVSSAQLIHDPDMRVINLAWIDPYSIERFLRVSREVPADAPGGMIVLTISDQTEILKLRSNQIELERHETIAVLAGGIAHELGNFLGAIRLASDAGKISAAADREREAFELIGKACERGAHLSDRLLQMSRSDTGVPEVIDTNRAIAHVADLATAYAESRAIKIATEPHDPPLTVFADQAELESALLNLVLNAAHAISESGQQTGQISVHCRLADPNTVEINVIDDGPGMTQDTLAHATGAFFTTRRKTGGHGMGLYLVNNFAQTYYGTFELFSEAGKGTTARLVLPLISKPADPLPEHEPTALHGLNVLVLVEDEILSTLLPQALTISGAEVHIASDPQNAVQDLHAKGAEFDIVIADASLATPIWSALEPVQPTFGTILLAEAQETVDSTLVASALVLRKPVALRAVLRSLSAIVRPKSAGAFAAD